MSEFDKYAGEYKAEIDKVARASGEKFEYFIDRRIRLMKRFLNGKIVSNMLDYGCGVGATEIFLKKYFPSAKICGVDASEECIRNANKLELDGVEFSEPKKFEDESFDVIYSNGTFHHIDHDKHHKIFEDFRRVLKPNGRLFIFENNPYNPLMMRVMRECEWDKDAKVIKAYQLKRRLIKAGFKVRRVRYYIFFPKFLAFLRVFEKMLGRVPFGAQYVVEAVK
jgi:SAM-dependent methyltransferase